MRVGALILVSGLVVAACGGTTATGPDESGPSEMMSAALEQLVTVDHTFGDGPPPFTEYLIQTTTDPFAGDALGQGDSARRLLTVDERSAIEEAISKLGPVRWIDDPDEWRTDDLRPTIDGAVILGVGEPVVDGETGLVPVSLWCGGVCGTWLTYSLQQVEDAWSVTGIEGPIAMS